jgi:6-phosphogluconolactonase
VTINDQSPKSSGRPSRRAVLGVAALAALAPVSLASARSRASSQAEDHGPGSAAESRYVYVGTYTAPNTAPGGTQPSTASASRLQDGAEDRRLSLIQIVPDIQPVVGDADPQQKVLYATSEVSSLAGPANSAAPPPTPSTRLPAA